VSADHDAWVVDERGAVTEISQVSLHHSFHLILSQVVEWLHERRRRQKQSAATCIRAEWLTATAHESQDYSNWQITLQDKLRW